MKCIHIPGGVLSVSDDIQAILTVNGESFTFEFDLDFGPVNVRRCEKPRTEPVPRHKFWTAVSYWAQQGRRIENGIAIWNEPEPLVDLKDFVKIGKRTYIHKQMAEEQGIKVLPLGEVDLDSMRRAVERMRVANRERNKDRHK